MRAVGVFRELSRHSGPTVPSIHTVAGQLSDETSAMVSSYLKRGVPLDAVMEATRDPFDKDIYISGGPGLLSDGVWVWRHDLSHYVSNYRIGLPTDFIEHVICEYSTHLDVDLIRDMYDEIHEVYSKAQNGESELQ